MNRCLFRIILNYYYFCLNIWTFRIFAYIYTIETNKQLNYQVMTIQETIELINILIAEKDPKNNELIAFYQRKVSEAYGNAISKAFK